MVAWDRGFGLLAGPSSLTNPPKARESLLLPQPIGDYVCSKALYVVCADDGLGLLAGPSSFKVGKNNFSNYTHKRYCDCITIELWGRRAKRGD